MKKCQWNNGVFSPCNLARKSAPYDCSEEESALYRGKSYINGNEIFFCPFCGASLEKPIEYKKGMFGTYANIKENLGKKYAKLCRFDLSSDRPFEIESGVSSIERVVFFNPGLPEGFNKDGTPKVITCKDAGKCDHDGSECTPDSNCGEYIT